MQESFVNEDPGATYTKLFHTGLCQGHAVVMILEILNS
jgi:hypothetical protein